MSLKLDENALYAVPLGGCGHFGANATLYAHQGKWLMVDCGMGFADETLPGVDIILPDLTFIEERRSDLVGLVVTHGHEDHIGAIEYLWTRLKCPIYGTPFTIGLVREKLSEARFGRDVELIEFEPEDTFNLGPFQITPISMAHSIPETVSLAIETGVGTLLHTGDWKIDPRPVTPYLTDEKTLRALGERDLLAIVGDSTNAMVPGHSGSEGDLAQNFAEIFAEFKNRIVVTCFSSNVARLDSIARAAKKCGREVALVGRSLWRIHGVSSDRGYLKGIDFLNEKEAAMMPRNKIVLICTGSQGEARAALARISNGEHNAVELDPGDVVLFSSRAIPGNEKEIFRTKNNFLAAGIHVITDREAPIHVSGHPYRDELRMLFGWTRPRAVIPVHGERFQQERHADLARECGVEQVLIPHNGAVIRITPGKPEIVDNVRAGLLALEGDRLVPVEHEAIQTRRRLMFNGSAVVTLVMNGRGDIMAEPKISAMGLVDENSEVDTQLVSEAADVVRKAVMALPKELRCMDDEVSEIVRVAARRYFQAQYDKKPQTRVHLIRI